MDLGWMMPCFDVADLARSTAFYEQLGFRRVGGNPAQGWAIMANGPMELGLYSGHFSGWMLNFRGGNVPELAAHFKQLGLNVTQESSYSAEQWPDAEQLFDGQLLPHAESGDCTVLDPEGRVLYFDTYPIERIRFRCGERYATDDYDGSFAEGQPRLGQWRIELGTPDLVGLQGFYEQLGVGSDSSDGCWSLDIVEAASPAVTFIAAGGDAPSQDQFDPDGYRIVIRP
jgi:catechol 2,3-dioxygenase-like lactoylglutathione lyase family enzyme